VRYSDLLVKNPEIYTPYLYLVPRRGRNFVKMFDAGKTRMIGQCVVVPLKQYDEVMTIQHEGRRRIDF